MTVNSERGLCAISGGLEFGTLAQLVNDGDELFDFGRLGLLFGDGGEFVVLDSSIFQTLGMIDGRFVADIKHDRYTIREYSTTKPLDELLRTVFIVHLSHRLHSTKDFADRFAAGVYGPPFLEVLDVPFSRCGHVLELPCAA